uniref:Uncharacterized protein n=1 Tax=Oryza meridionalis TaxID=40149 RepID=A0A0E0EQ76_9ORYZ
SSTLCQARRRSRCPERRRRPLRRSRRLEPPLTEPSRHERRQGYPPRKSSWGAPNREIEPFFLKSGRRLSASVHRSRPEDRRKPTPSPCCFPPLPERSSVRHRCPSFAGAHTTSSESPGVP